LLRVLYADQADPADLLRAVESAQVWARSETERGLAQLEDYRATGGPLPDRLHLTALFADLCARLFEAVDSWAADAATEVQFWPRTHAVGATPGTTTRLDDMIDRPHQLLSTTSRPTAG
jgi:PadR family transcriptional regulator AphA